MIMSNIPDKSYLFINLSYLFINIFQIKIFNRSIINLRFQ